MHSLLRASLPSVGAFVSLLACLTQGCGYEKRGPGNGEAGDLQFEVEGTLAVGMRNDVHVSRPTDTAQICVKGCVDLESPSTAMQKAYCDDDACSVSIEPRGLAVTPKRAGRIRLWVQAVEDDALDSYVLTAEAPVSIGFDSRETRLVLATDAGTFLTGTNIDTKVTVYGASGPLAPSPNGIVTSVTGNALGQRTEYGLEHLYRVNQTGESTLRISLRGSDVARSVRIQGRPESEVRSLSLQRITRLSDGSFDYGDALQELEVPEHDGVYVLPVATLANGERALGGDNVLSSDSPSVYLHSMSGVWDVSGSSTRGVAVDAQLFLAAGTARATLPLRIVPAVK